MQLMMTNKEILDLLVKRKDRFEPYYQKLSKSLSEKDDSVNWKTFLQVLHENQRKLSRDEAFFDKTVEKQKQLFNLQRRLQRSSYCLTEDDIDILRNNLVFVAGPRERIDATYDDTFVVISDFFGYPEKIEDVVENLTAAYDTVYIMGNATVGARLRTEGETVIPYLQKIKALTEQFPTKVIYIPGDRDQLIVGYYRWYEELAEGIYIENLREKLRSNDELMQWLEKLPIQREHQLGNVLYGIAHGFFNQNMADEHPDCCFDDFYRQKLSRREIKDIVWYKQGSPWYVAKDCPRKGTITVTGNTTCTETNRHSLTNDEGDSIPVICVDGDMMFDGKNIQTYNHHAIASNIKRLDESEAVLQNHIIESVYNNGSEVFADSNDDFYQSVFTTEQLLDIINSLEKRRTDFHYTSSNLCERFAEYKKIVVFDTIVERVVNDFPYAKGLLNGYIFCNPDKKNPFTKDADTAFLAEALGIENMQEVLANHYCESVADYIALKGENDRTYQKVYGKNNK